MLKKPPVVVVIVKYCPLPGTSIVLMRVLMMISPLMLPVCFRTKPSFE